MADNLKYNEPGSGPLVATDDVSSTHYQIVKLDIGKPDGATIPIVGQIPVFVNSGFVSITSAVDTELPAAANLQDDLANPSTPSVGALLSAFDGSNWDRVRLDALTRWLQVIASGTVHGMVAPDAPASSYPIAIGAIAEVAGDSQPANLVSAEGDIVRISAGRDGAVYTKPHPPRIWNYNQEFTSRVTNYNIHSGVTNLSHYLGSIYCVFSGAMMVWLRDGLTDTSTMVWKYYAGGQGDGAAITFNPPMKLASGNAVGFSMGSIQTCYLAVTGYTAP